MNTFARGARCSVLFAALLLTGAAADAAGPKVCRCGPDGRIYSQTPCKDGYEVNADDQRSAEQRKAALDTVKREEKLADKMTREREAKEAAAAKQVAGSFDKAKPPAAAASAPKAKKKRAPKKPVQA